MKKRAILLFIILPVLLCSLCHANQITASLVSQNIDVSIVVEGPPSLLVFLPYNETYLTNYSIPLNYSANDGNVFYNIDEGINTSLIGQSNFTTFNTAEGLHILKVFANNSYGTTEKRVYFSVNLTILKFYYEEYKGTEKGNSTDFLSYTYERMQNVSVVLENTNYGKIEWYDLINFTQTSVVDLDSYTNISYNSIYFAAEQLQPLNKSAKIYFYNVTFTSPVITVNGEQCPPSICALISYENQTFIFNVTSFASSATYAIQEPLNILWPEGVYEPSASGLAGTHRFSFNITFNNLTAENQSRIECDIEQSNKSLLILNKTMQENLSNGQEYLSYNLTSGNSVDKTMPWKIKNCTISKGGTILFSSTYLGHLNGNIYVHNNTWTRFSSIDDDAYRAADCFLGIPKKYFNNTEYCDYAGDVAFSVTMSRGMNIEGECHDSIDNDNNGLIDCSDIYCQGITYSCKNHAYAGDPFAGDCNNGICSETKTVGGKSFTYYYTRYVKPQGLLKFRIVGDGYSTANPVSFAITDLIAFSNHSKYNITAFALPNEQISGTSYKTEAPSGLTGNFDYVMYVKLNYSEGSYNISLYARQYGEDLLIAGIPIVVLSSAPSNTNESEEMPVNIVSPCADSVDNDLDYYQNCADTDCIGYVGGVNCAAGNALCASAESNCSDCFDNNANGLTDCSENSCDLMPGNYLNLSNLCEYNGEGYGSINATYDASYSWISACSDSFNNDREDGTDCYDISHCRGKGGTSLTLPCPAYENNSLAWCFDSIDNDYDGLKDCSDPDCLGLSYGSQECYQNETLDSNGAYKLERCFDNIDNDLDASADCADSDCNGITNPNNSNQTCQYQEFNLTEKYQYCTDDFDNNANSLVDCYDLSCKQKFGSCGPCPSAENYTWRSCADGLDDDLNGQTDCFDANCAGEIGSTSSGQICGSELCNDSFDNDANTKTDCADTACDNQTGPNGEICQTSETNCTDNFDNDADGFIDCSDSDCFGVGSCSASWNTSSCLLVPYYTSMQVGATTVSINYLSRHYVGTNYTIRLTGTGSYSSIAIILGDATDSGKYFPYNATSCILSGSSKLKWVASQEQVGQIQHNPAQVNQANPLSGFDVNLTCSAVNINQSKSYPISIANLESGNSESAEALLTSTVYENTAPNISSLEIEPSNGSLIYGDSLRVRVVPNPDSSGICKCYLNVSGTEYSNTNCIITLSNLANDTTYSLSAKAEDGAGNVGSYSSIQNFSVSIKPKKLTSSIDKHEPFYKGTENFSFAGSFITSLNNSFSSLCYYSLRNSTDEIYSGTFLSSASENSASCSVSLAVPNADNQYKFEARINDSQNNEAKSDSKVIYVCNNLSSAYCSKADFDQDEVTEGVYTSLYGAPQACDMCIDQVNLDIDKNANGIDAVCDPNEAVVPPIQPPQPSKPPVKPVKAPFTVSPNKILIKTVKDAAVSETITITNQQEEPIFIDVDMKMLGSIKTHPVSGIISFTLNPGESKEFEIEFNTSQTGTYTSKILVSGGGFTAEIPVTLIVEKRELPAPAVAPFEISIFITLSKAGKLLKIDTLLSNLTVSGEGTINYQIKDFEGNTVWESSDLITLREGMFTKEILLPDLMPGDYTVAVSVLYAENVIIKTKEFTILKAKPMIPPGIVDIILIAATIIVIMAIIYIIIRKILKKRTLQRRFISRQVRTIH